MEAKAEHINPAKTMVMTMNNLTEIYFNDLTEDKQAEILEQTGAETPEQVNMDVFPLAVTNIPKHAGDNP